MKNLKWFQWLLSLDKDKLVLVLLFIGMSYLYFNLKSSQTENNGLKDEKYKYALTQLRACDSINAILKAENIQFYKDQIKRLEENLSKIDTAIRVNKTVIQDNMKLLKKLK